MTNRKEESSSDKSCICMDCKSNLAKKFDELLNSFNEESCEIIHELIHTYSLLQDALHTDINSSIAELNRKGCVKVNISFTGKTIENKKIKLKDDVIVHIE